MKITYIYHSCFSLELEDTIFLFDYYKGNLPNFDTNKKIYVFSSHKHYDHFNKDIFTLMKDYTNVSYILSSDIKMNEKYMDRVGLPEECRDKIQYLNKNQTYELSPTITVSTLTSTDEGVAFLIDYCGQLIYYAGDLNWWTWIGETQEEYEDMTRRFQNEINKLEGKKIVAAFLPLDPRQEDRFWWGFDYYMKKTDTLHAFPMHFWENPSVIEKLKNMDAAAEYKDRIEMVLKEGDVYEI